MTRLLSLLLAISLAGCCCLGRVDGRFIVDGPTANEAVARVERKTEPGAVALPRVSSAAEIERERGGAVWVRPDPPAGWLVTVRPAVPRRADSSAIARTYRVDPRGIVTRLSP